MLPAGARLRRASQIRAVSRHGARVARDGISVHVWFSGSSGSHVAVVVGKPAGNAVARNRLRRQVRHCLVRRLDALPAGADIVIRARPPADRLTAAALESAVTACLRRAAARARP